LANTSSDRGAILSFVARVSIGIAKPFDWTFTRQDLAELLDRLDQKERDPPLALVA